MIGQSQLELSEFFHGTPPFINNTTGGLASALSPFGASIQKSWRYRVSFVPDIFRNTDINRINLYKRVGKMPIIRAWQVESVSIPQYSFSKVTQKYGPVPRSLPVLDDHNGFEVKLRFIEDSLGTINNFCTWLQRCIIDKDSGNYAPPDCIKIPMIAVMSENDIGIPITIHTLHDAFYLTANGPDYDYAANEKITYDITFNVDIINNFAPQSYGMQQLTNLLF